VYFPGKRFLTWAAPGPSGETGRDVNVRVQALRNTRTNTQKTRGTAMKSDSGNGVRLNRREALLFSAAAGMGMALAKEGHASDSTKTAAHRLPAAAPYRVQRWQRLNMARCADISTPASSL